LAHKLHLYTMLPNSWSARQESPIRRSNTHPAHKRPCLFWSSFIRALLFYSLIVSLNLEADGQSAPSLGLHDAIQQAKTGPLAREGQDRVDAAHGLITGAVLRPNPRLYLSSEDIQPWNNNFNFASNTEDFGYLGQLVELGGKRASRLGLARATFTQTESERTLLLQQIVARVAGAYWVAVASQGIVSLLEQDMKAVDRIVVFNQERVQAGATRGVDLIRVEIERDRLQLALEAARRDLALNRIELFKQIGRESQPNIELTDRLDSFYPIKTQEIATILAARADVAVARDAVTVAQANLQLQRSLGIPDIDVLAGYKRNSGADTLYSSVQIPLNFRNRNQGEVERAQATVRLQQDRLIQLELAVRAEVDAAQQAYTHQQKIISVVLPDMRARASQNLAIMDDAYRTGGVDLLRYLDAERTEFEIEVSALRTLTEFQQAVVRLQIAYGVQP
jgi:cobalt-zinc-cadmium efflux system outer membrane protein